MILESCRRWCDGKLSLWVVSRRNRRAAGGARPAARRRARL